MPELQARPTCILDFIAPVLLLAAAIVIAYPRWEAGIDWRDEGLLAYGAVRVLNGEIPHRDFVSLQPSLSYYSAAAVFKLLGTSLAGLLVLGFCIFLLFPLLFYSLDSLITRTIPAVFAAIPACMTVFS